MAYIVVTTDKGKVVFKRHHLEYPAVPRDAPEQGIARLLNDLATAVLQAEKPQATIEGDKHECSG